MNPSDYVSGDGFWSKRTAESVHRQAVALEAKMKAEPGRENAPAVCRCSHSFLVAGCQCPGYVSYRERERGY